MRISAEEWERYEEYPLLDDDFIGYAISYDICVEDEAGAKRELYRMVNVLYRLITKYYESPKAVRGICGVSNHDHNTKIIHKKKGNRGRKKKTFLGGKVVKWHIHVYLYTKEKKLATLTQEFKVKQDIRQAKNKLPKCFRKKLTDKERGNKCYDATNYVLGQSTYTRTIGGL